MTALTTIADTMTEHAMFGRMEAHDTNQGFGRCRAFVAYEAELQRRHDEGRDYPIGDRLECYTCPKVGRAAPMRTCTGLGPVTNPADPTQTYRLDCGHVTI